MEHERPERRSSGNSLPFSLQFSGLFILQMKHDMSVILLKKITTTITHCVGNELPLHCDNDSVLTLAPAFPWFPLSDSAERKRVFRAALTQPSGEWRGGTEVFKPGSHERPHTNRIKAVDIYTAHVWNSIINSAQWPAPSVNHVQD